VIESPFPSAHEVVDFILTITNTGNVMLRDVVVQDPLTGFEQVIGDLLPNASLQYQTSYTVTLDDDLNGQFENTALVSATAPDGSTVEGSSTIIVDVNQCLIIIPNGFSPNDDNIQDLWRITCLDNFPNARV